MRFGPFSGSSVMSRGHTGTLVAAVLGVAVLSGALSSPALAQPGGPSRVSVVPAERRMFHPSVEALGRIEAVKDTLVGTEVFGLVDEVLVIEGQRVEQGEVLARLSTSLRDIRRRQAEADLELARQQLAEFRAGTRPEELREAEAALEDAIAQEEEARLDRERVEALEGTDAVSDDEITSARAIERSRAAWVRQRQAILDRLREGPRREVIARADAQVAASQARLDEIDDEIAKTVIRAPFTGVITEKSTEVGMFVREGDSLFGLVQMDPVRAVLFVSEGALGGVAPGQSARVWTVASPTDGREGAIESIIPRGDPAARTFPVMIHLANGDGRLLPGMGVRGRIQTSTPEPLLAVPADALAESPVGPVVFVVREGKAERVDVRPGFEEQGFVAITGEIEPGEPIVVLGNETLRPGSPVQVVERERGGDGR